MSAWLPLVHVDDHAVSGFYDGWIIEAVEGDRLLFEQSHKPKDSLLHEVQEAPFLLRDS